MHAPTCIGAAGQTVTATPWQRDCDWKSFRGNKHSRNQYTFMDLSTLAASVPPPHRDEFVMKMQQKQMQDGVKLYNEICATCFSRCVNTFHTKTVTGQVGHYFCQWCLSKLSQPEHPFQEEKCIERCVQKFFKTFQRVQLKFGQRQEERRYLQ